MSGQILLPGRALRREEALNPKPLMEETLHHPRLPCSPIVTIIFGPEPNNYIAVILGSLSDATFPPSVRQVVSLFLVKISGSGSVSQDLFNNLHLAGAWDPKP